jgi:DNA helicase-2/ATP-dependent DNA helicase PcrA
MIDKDIFGDVDKSKLRLAKPANGIPPLPSADNMPKPDLNVRKLKPIGSNVVPQERLIYLTINSA